MQEVDDQLLISIVQLLTRGASCVELQEMAVFYVLSRVLKDGLSNLVGFQLVQVVTVEFLYVDCIKIDHVQPIVSILLDEHKQVVSIRDEAIMDGNPLSLVA